VKSFQNTSMVPLINGLLEETRPTVDGEMQNINLYFLSICRYTIPYRLFHQTSRVVDLMVGFILRDISLQERRRRVSFGLSESSTTGVDSGGRRSGSVALYWANSEVRVGRGNKEKPRTGVVEEAAAAVRSEGTALPALTCGP